MYISSFHIDGFGILSDVTVEDLHPGINIFFGPNEAGKSTCLEFLRAMLTGYPLSKELKAKYKPVSGAQPGGSLLINCENQDGSLEKIHLTRRPSPSKGLTLLGEDGNLIAEERLAAIFAGISPEVYHKVFGFSLGELESFENLSAEGVREALYGASFGPGLVSPALALEELKKRKDKLLKNSAAQPSLNSSLSQLEEKRALILQKESDIAAYDQYCNARDRHREELASLQIKRGELEARQRKLQRRLSIWEQWDQWRKIKDRLERMPLLPPSFPAEALQRLAMIRAMRDERERDLAAQRKKLESLRERRSRLVYDKTLVELRPALHSLAERKSAYRQALNDLDGITQNLDRAREELGDLLTRLGSEWDCGRIRGTNRSLFARENLSRHEEELHNAQLSYQAARDSLESANQEVEACEKAWESANEVLAQFPEPKEIISASEQDELRQAMGRLNESRRLEKTREEAFKNAREAFFRALSQAKIAINIDDMDILAESEKILKNIDSHREEARLLADELKTRQDELEAIRQKSARLEENAESIRLKAEATIAQTQANPASSRDLVEARSRALRSLRSLGAQINSTNERLQDLEGRISSLPQPAPAFNWTLLVTAGLLIFGGGGLFLAHYFLGLTEFTIPNGPAISINLWMCYLALACGVVMLAFGLPANSEEKRRHQKEVAQLQASRENTIQRLAEYNEQARQLLEMAEVASLDPITLDAAEMLLEREKEQCIHEERSQREAENLQRELTAIRMQLSAMQRDAQQKEREIQQCRRGWLSLVESMHITDCPSPESLSTVFARVEAASIALGNVQSCNQELEELWEDLHILESTISSMPAIEQRLQSAPEPLCLEDAVKQTLEAFNESNNAKEQRNIALSALKTVENTLMSARRRQDEAALRLEKASENLDERRKDWAGVTADFGLGENMDPAIMREALQLMDQALLAEEKLARYAQERQRSETEKLTFEAELADFLTRLGKDTDENADRILQLDSLLQEADKALEILNEQKQLDKLISGQEDEYGAREASLEAGKSQLRALLLQGEKDNENDFVETARLVEEKRDLENELGNLESSLRVAAGKEPMEVFLQAFQEEKREDQEQRLYQLERELAELGNRIQEEATSLGNMEGRLENMVADDSLSRLRQEEAILSATVEEKTWEWAKISLAEAILLKAKQKFEKERQPEVIRIASDIFSLLTNGKWLGLKSSLEDTRLEFLSAQGENIPTHLLSRGTQEQAYLALRLAYIRDHARHATPLPLIMDEILVNFDPERAERAAHSFAELVQNPPQNKVQQILYFTCQPHIVDMLRAKAPDSRLYTIEKGNISAA